MAAGLVDDARAGDQAIVTLEGAGRALLEAFGPLMEADYVPGKTDLRDALAARFEISLLEAEDLCDELERAEVVRFVETAEGPAWNIRPGEEEG